MISCDRERLKISGDFMEVATELGCIIDGVFSQDHPDYVNNTLYRSVIASMAVSDFQPEDKNLLYYDKAFNEGVNEVINSVKALKELCDNIIETKK